MTMRREYLIWLPPTLIAVLLLASYSLPANAAKVEVIPSIALEESWDSNIFNTPSDENSDFISRVKPRLDFQFATYQTTTKIGGGIQSEWYADHSELNSYTALKNLDLTVAEPLQITPRFWVSPYASFVESDDAVRRNELTQALAPDIPPSEAVVTGRTKTRDYRGFLRMRYLLTPRVDISAGGGVTRREFSGTTGGIATTGLTLENSTQTVGDADIFYAVSPRLSSGIFLNTGFNSFETSPDSMTFTGGVAGRYKLTPMHTLMVRGGATYLRESAAATGPQGIRWFWFPYGNLAVEYTWQRFTARLAGSYELVGAGSFGQTTKRGNISLTMTHQFAEKWWGNLSGFYQNNRSFEDPVTVNVDTVQGTAGMRYAALKWASFYLNGNIVRQRSKALEGSDVARESVFLGVLLSTTYEPD